MKKRKKIVLIIIAIIAVILSFIGGNAFAKYMSKVEGKGSADIASWKFKVNENDENLQTISLSSTINNETLSNYKIAPGTEGKFQINLDATGAEVGVDYQIRFENETQKPTNLVFMYQGNNYSSIKELEENLKGTINANEEEKTKAIEVNWKWAYETGETLEEISRNDEIDTEELQRISNYSFDIIVSGTQVVPQNS